MRGAFVSNKKKLLFHLMLLLNVTYFNDIGSLFIFYSFLCFNIAT